MWPWAHAAVGYLAYSSHSRFHHGDAPTTGATVAVAVGTQFPDIVDKPLGWTLGVLPAGRSLAHSLFAVALVSGLVWTLARSRRRGAVGVAFGVGYLSHVLTDGLYPALRGAFADLSYLAWPALPAPEPEVGQSFLAHLRLLELDGIFLFELALVALATAVWALDGRPGFAWFRSRVPGTEDDGPGSGVDSRR